MDDEVLRIQVAVAALVAVLVFGLVGGLMLVRQALGGRALSPAARRFALLLSLGCLAYGTWIEADWLSETRIEVPTAHLPRGQRLRIVQLSDLHVSGPTRALAELPGRVNALSPDLLIYTGDSINGVEGLPELHRVLTAIHPRYGRYAVQGNHDVWYWRGHDLFGEGVATELVGPAVSAAEGKVTLCGARYGEAWKIEAFREIHRRFPHLDLALMPIAPLEPHDFMAPNHVNADESVQGFLDVGADRMIPIHFDTFINSYDRPGEAGAALERSRLARGLSREQIQPLEIGEQRVLIAR